jgi:DNA polymerase-1
MRIALIDGDLLLYRFGYRGESSIDWGDGVVSHWTTETSAIADMKSHVEKTTKTIRADRTVVCLSDSRCFRYDIMSTYKHNRKDVVKPVLLGVLKQYFMDHYETCLKPKLEADDCLGIKATLPSQHNSVICSIDKDMRQIPGYHFNWNKDTKTRVVSEKEADLFFYEQVLQGDPTDGYSGCPGVGKVKAKAVIAAVPPGKDWHKDVWAAIVQVYENKGLDESYALTQARMARILRATDYDLEKQEIIWWTPAK